MALYKIKKTNIDRKGLGLYAAKNIKKGKKIINYIGKIILKNKLRYQLNMTMQNQYIFLI